MLWSGGKDSTILLWEARKLRPDIECIQWRLPWMAGKWGFHQYLAELWGLCVHETSPSWSALCHGNDRVDVIETFLIGAQGLTLARGTEPYEEGKEFVCVRDWLERPKVMSGSFPFDVLLCGHKNVDEDPCSGPVPLEVDRLEIEGSATIWYPLRKWTDEMVCARTLEEKVPWDSNRYDLVADRTDPADRTDRMVLRTKSDKRGNSDYYHACLRCVDRREGDFVRCPKMGIDITNVSGSVRHYEPSHKFCNLRAEKAKCEMGNTR